MKIFVTGATGFSGSHLVPKLLARGDAVTCLVRDPNKATPLSKMGAQLAAGDVTQRESMRVPMQSAETVFHLAGMYEFGKVDVRRMRAVNVDGTHNTLELAAELGVPHIIHASTVGVFGNTHGKIVDEAYRIPKETLPSVYEQTKWEAHYDVAVPLQQKGAPVIIVQPGGVTGPGDTSPHAAIFDSYLNRMPFMFGATSGLTWAHVDDIAAGHIAALDKGKSGEAYILAGPCLTYKQSMEMWQAITGIPIPKIWMPGWATALTGSVVGLIERAGGSVPLVSSESLGSLTDYTFWASADKAKRELGWQPRPVEELLREVLDYELRKRGKK